MLLQKYSVPTTILLTSLLLTVGCSPKVQVEVPNEPITINLNVKIEHEILVKVDKEVDTLLTNQKDLF
ncbi:YnbE family lipoprotein [Neptunomonas phycophila]|uniref:YnbE family lipoprotein n=1 Tax=Neptunomonas phycophila TaxID=1572645 RepID=A0ABT9EY21_9GAMM|nr:MULTISPECIES: YnbE family lipoprotein [Neptunomonas]MDN2661552.1 YnbE family lipoprotein [Neptunomonas sp. CHC150]MDO6469806.1 YnbE family lipoprotein [Neptunomonas phycophila]MDP2523941.1 YnbE family lipoprotein [Neptunomonas phycophila]